MALPTTRDYDAVDAGPLPHTTLNNIQDSIVALEGDRAGERIEEYSIASIMAADMSAVNPPKISLSVNIDLVSSAARVFVIPFNLRNGQRLVKWRTLINHDTASTHVLGISLIRWGGTKDPFTKAIAAAYENVPTQATVLSSGALGDERLESLASPLPVVGGEEYQYGLEFLTVLGGGPLGVIRLNTIALTTDYP